jgi:hypothetical protein
MAPDNNAMNSLFDKLGEPIYRSSCSDNDATVQNCDRGGS